MIVQLEGGDDNLFYDKSNFARLFQAAQLSVHHEERLVVTLIEALARESDERERAYLKHMSQDKFNV